MIDDPRTIDDGEAVTTLRDAARVFASRPGPRLIAATVAGCWARRARLGAPTAGDLVAALAVAAWWPLQEWAAHRWLLHLRPRDVAGVRLDPHFARVHRAHHRAPRRIAPTLLPLGVVLGAIPGSLAVFRGLIPGRKARRTAMATYASMALLYEWTHFLVHTGVKPRSALYRRIRRNHRLHHYRNERYWLGFTLPHVDALLGTEPDPRSVPHSPTARDLFGLGAEGDDGAAGP
ncbi:MAG: sterol desaturase family protein [Polyangiales bacterium]